MTVTVSLDEGVGRLVVDNPPVNVLTRDVMAEVRRRLDELSREESLRVLVLRAEGKHFSAGADVGEHLPPTYEELIREFLDTVRSLYGFPLPVIAGVQGRCMGGGFELVQAADMVVAAEGASFGQPEILLGVLPPAACVLLPRLCPPGVAARLVYSGDPIGAGEAHAAGLVIQVVPDDQLEEAVSSLAGRMSRHSAAALRIGKRMFRGESSRQVGAALDRAGLMYRTDLMCTRDAVEGLRAFLDKRPPSWSHS